MPDWLWSLLGGLGVPLLLFLWQAILTRDRTEEWGRKCGLLIKVVFRQRLGVAGSLSMRDRFISTVEDFVRGLRLGLEQKDR